nr:intermembrane lipid transfer protein VPS13D-like [Lytechinus pictus]
MLERLAAWVLNTYLGEYVENLNTDQLSIGLLTGAVELENLPLRKDALRELDLPVEVKAGFIGKICLQIPVRHLKTEPWVISIENLYLVAGPALRTKYDEKEEEQEQERKQQQLDAMESQWKRKIEASGPNEDSSWYAYSTNIFYNVLENLQLKIKDVHIRYEDSTILPGMSLAFGITIKSISAVSTDENYSPRQTGGEKATGGMKFKLVGLENFAVYWDTDSAHVSDFDLTDLKDALMSEKCRTTNNLIKEHDYIIEPVSAEARLQRNGSALPLRSRTTPRFVCDLTLQKIPLSLSENQYRGITVIMKEFERNEKARHYRKWRPEAWPDEKEGMRSRWQFAIDSILHSIKDRSKRRSPKFISERIGLIRQYMSVYTNFLEEKVDPASFKKVMTEFEKDLSFEEIRILRNLVYGQLEKRIRNGEEIFKKPEEVQQGGIMQRWVWGWGGWSSQKSSEGMESSVDDMSSGLGSRRSPSPPPLIDVEEEQELLDVLGDPSADNNLLRRDHVFALLNFKLQGGSIKLCTNSHHGNRMPPSSASSTTSIPPSSPVDPGTSPPDDPGEKETIIELEFASVKMSFEWRLRTSSFLFTAKLGALFIHDVMTKGSLFPNLVAPQQKREDPTLAPRQSHSLLLSRSASSSFSYLSPSSSGTSIKQPSSDLPVFEMSYESNPPHSNADCRLEIISRPLDIVYNPTAIERVSNFFNKTEDPGNKGLSSRSSELQLTRSARIRYQEIKLQTKQELIDTVDSLLEGEKQTEIKRWDVHFDISAPLIIIPDNFHNKDATLVVLDLGRLQLLSITAKGRHKKKSESEQPSSPGDEGDLDDDFLTPLSTPPQESTDTVTTDTKVDSMTASSSGIDIADFGSSALTAEAFRDKMYDRYTLDMSDLQILVAKGSENWRTAHSRGLCPFQVLDKFSISVKVERRLTSTADPQWPSMTLSGNLPSLSIHINEKKIQALNKCMKIMSGSNNQPGVSPAGYSPPIITTATTAAAAEHPAPQGRTHLTSQSDLEATIHAKTQAILEESKLLEMQFSVDKVSLAIHSRGRCISEFQVSQVRADLVKRSFDSSISLSVHSLLVIDALQQFGPDFELLLASHRDLSMHAPSGSIVDSEASTPRSLQSPTSPRSPASPAEKMMETTSHAELASAIYRKMGVQSKGGNQSTSSSIPPPAVSPIEPVVTDSEALISVELQFISPESPSRAKRNGSSKVFIIHFNTLDVIANQETIVELLSFFQRAFPEDESKPKQPPSDPSSFTNSLLREASIIEPSNNQTGTMTDIAADFRCLNIVLVRGIMGNKVKGQKVATATVREAHIQAALGEEMSVEGFLGGLQLLDLTPEGSRHQKVFSVGQDPTTIDQSSADISSLLKPSDQTESTVDSSSKFTPVKVEETKGDKDNLKALTFNFRKQRQTATLFGSSIKIQVGEEDTDEQMNLSLHLASLCYIHVPRFLHEVTLCMDEFQSSIANLANSIQKAASDAARELIQSKMPDLVTSFSPSMFNTMMESPGQRADKFGNSSVDMTDSHIGAKSNSSMNFDIIMETPVIIIPRTASSSELLVGHLGKISLTNNESSEISCDMDIESASGLDMSPDMTRFFLRIQNVNLFSFNHDDTNLPLDQSVTSVTSDIMSIASRPYSGTPILHNTSLEVIVNQIPEGSGPPVMDNSMAFPDIEDNESLLDQHSSTLQVVGKVVTPLKVILSKQIYEQILQTLDNLTYQEPTKVPSTPVSLENTKDRKSGIFNVKELEPLGIQSKTPGHHKVTESTPIQPAGSKIMRICANFAMPDLCIQMRGDLSEGDQGIVNVCFSDFRVDYEKSCPASTSITILLQSLVIEDLLQSPDSKHRQLVASRGGASRSSSGPLAKMVHSTSCPSVTAMPAVSPIRPSSVPSELNNPDQYYAPQYSRQTSSSSRGMYPSTPPPSLNISLEDINVSEESVPTSDALVQIRVLLVDKKSSEFATKYKKTNQFVDVEFNQLDITINQQTWVVLLDFLGIGSSLPKDNIPQQTSTRTSTTHRQSSEIQPQPTQQTIAEEPDGNNMEMQVHMASLSLILNKPDYELAKASVSEVNAHMTNVEGNLDVKGHMGSMSVLDLTPHGRLYRERFTTKGEEALSFHIFKYGKPDKESLREFDMSVKLRMSTVRYVHTNRFQSEVVAFAQQFNQLQEVLSTMRAAAAGHKVFVEPTRSARIMLDVQAGSPVMLAPVSSQSKDLLVINLGNLTLRNKFLLSGTPGTITHKSCPPRPSPEDSKASEGPSKHARETPRKVATGTAHGLKLEDSPGLGLGTAPGVLTRTAPSKPIHGPQYQSTPKHSPRVSEKASEMEVDGSRKEENMRCLLDCIHIDLEDMDLYSAERVSPTDFDVSDGTALIFPSFIVQRKGGKLLKQTCLLKLQVDRNLDIDIRRTVPDMEIDGLLSSVHCCLDLSQYQLIRGFLDHNLGEHLEEFQPMPRPANPESQTVLSGQICTNISMHINLVNVTLELLLQHASDPIIGLRGREPEEAVPERSLGQFNFMESKFSFVSQSNGSRMVDLVSHAIRAYDTRWKGDTSKKRSNVFEEILTPTRHHSRNPNPLQLELHYASQADNTRATALLNNMRVVCVFDLLLAVKDFLLAYDSQAIQGADGASARASSETSTSLDPSTESSNVTTVDKSSRSPVSIGAGILTKRVPHREQVEKNSDFKVNVTETEFVILEDTSSSDSNAVILKSTCAVLTHKPVSKENPFSCGLEGLEIFSCRMSSEEDTALSIVDPSTINVELKGTSSHVHSGQQLGGLLDIMDAHAILEVHIQALNIRVSYHDTQLFLSIMNSLPSQMIKKQHSEEDEEEVEAVDNKRNEAEEKTQSKSKVKRQISKLKELGFHSKDCRKALEKSNYRLDLAAGWLLENAKPIPSSSPAHSPRDAHHEEGNSAKMEIAGIEVRAGSLAITLIDDCGNIDIPLIEISCQNLNFFQKLLPSAQGQASCVLSADYYHRSLSGWEPCLEPWKCNVEWIQQAASQMYGEKLFIQMKVNDRLDLNVTSALIDLYSNTKKSWTEDYYSKGGATGSGRTRSPFVPFAIKNESGCKLSFATLTTTPNKVVSSPEEKLNTERTFSTWKDVQSGQEIPFMFEEKGKARHRNTHELRVHQLVVKVDGWEQLTPVSVDKVGVFFRHAKPHHNQLSIIFSDQQPARVVFHVSLEGGARKLITVRSALMVVSRLSVPLELKLVNPQSSTNNPQYLKPLEPNQLVAIPLPCVSWDIYLRPKGWAVSYCDKPLLWRQVQYPGDSKSFPMECRTDSGDSGIFRFCLFVKHEAFPSKGALGRRSQTKKTETLAAQPGHTLTILPPMVLTNLLPMELNFLVVRSKVQGCIRPGMDEPIYTADLDHAQDIKFFTESFRECTQPLTIPAKHNSDGCAYIELRDSHPKRRSLQLAVRVECVAGRALKVYVSASYWLINKSGLPLVFREEGADFDAAGQYDEHERARSVAPLMFSYKEPGKMDNMCVMRLGQSIIGLEGRPNWCHRISLEGGTGVRSLRIFQDGGRPHIVYNIGIDVRPGKGRYLETKIVTFVPRFQLENQSSHHLAFAQRHLTTGLGPENPKNHLAITSGSKVIFHWPRDDLDKLLCIRMHDLEGCRWSGGIRIDQPGSLNINMRSQNNQTNIIHVEIRLRGATFYVIFTDTTDLPPPYRIDNMSQVDIIYYQRGVSDPTLRTMLRPKMSVPYAWDEPILHPHMVCEVKGGSSSVYNLDKLEEGNHLYYENFIYIAMDSTFKGAPSTGSLGESSSNKNFWSSAQLVFDVPHADSPVVLRKKEPGKRSQLWRMTSTGLLQNEAFTPPRDPSQRRGSLTSNGLVLDIISGQFASQDEMILKLRKPDKMRQNTQTWYFGKDGRLRCQDKNYVVQPKFGLLSLKEGSELILVPGGRLDVSQEEIPLEQVITRQKNLPGSGNLSVKVMADGPTRVLYISDNIQQSVPKKPPIVIPGSSVEEFEMVDVKARMSKVTTESQNQEGSSSKKGKELEIALWLKEGVGVSLVNRVPEELTYITLTGIDVHYLQTSKEVDLNASVCKVQIDNQLAQAQKPVMLFASDKEGRAALSLVATKQIGGSPTVEIYKRLVLTVSKMTLNVEELLLLKLLQMGEISQPDITTETADETHYETISPRDNNQPMKRYFFETLKIHATDFRLSMYTSIKIPKDLNQLKTGMRLFLIQFEEAPVSLDPFTRLHPFETQEFLLDSIVKHYTEELKSQAVKILGSVDFLGNPIGLLQDFKDGLKELVLEGSVTGLVKNVTHGMSNTAAKVTGTISDGIGTATFDNRHQEMRNVIRETHDGTSSGHLSAGVKGFAFGVVGGLTSMFTQTYKGASEDGVEGLMKGIGRGIMGTVTKPAAGLFDLASGTMAAIRSSTTNESHLMPPRVRPPRCCRSPSGVLARYSLHDSRGMEFVSVLCEGTSGERYFMMEELRNHPSDGMQVLITSECTYFLSLINLQEPVLTVFHSELFHAKHILQAGKHYIELTKVANTEAGVSAPSLDLKERPKVGCDNERIAKKVSQQINYAKSCYEELKQQVIIKSDDAFLKLHLPSSNDD